MRVHRIQRVCKVGFLNFERVEVSSFYGLITHLQTNYL